MGERGQSARGGQEVGGGRESKGRGLEGVQGAKVEGGGGVRGGGGGRGRRGAEGSMANYRRGKMKTYGEGGGGRRFRECANAGHANPSEIDDEILFRDRDFGRGESEHVLCPGRIPVSGGRGNLLGTLGYDFGTYFFASCWLLNEINFLSSAKERHG